MRVSILPKTDQSSSRTFWQPLGQASGESEDDKQSKDRGASGLLTSLQRKDRGASRLLTSLHNAGNMEKCSSHVASLDKKHAHFCASLVCVRMQNPKHGREVARLSQGDPDPEKICYVNV